MNSEKQKELLQELLKEVKQVIEYLDDSEMELDEMMYQSKVRLEYVQETILTSLGEW